MKKTGDVTKTQRMPKTVKMLDKDPKFNRLPADMKQNIMSYLSRPVGRPKATPVMIKDAKKKNQMRMRLNKQSERALQEGDFESYIDIVEEMKTNNYIGKKAYDNRVDKFINNMNKMMVTQPEFDEAEYVEQVEPKTDKKAKEIELDETADALTNLVLQQSQREVKIEEGAPVRLKVVDEYSEPSIPTERTTQKMQEAAMNRATKKMFQREREEALKKRSQLSDHFTTYDKSKEAKAKQEAPDEPREKLQKETGMKYNTVPKKVQNDIRNMIAETGKEFDYRDIEFAWDNNLDEITKERIAAGDLTGVDKINNLIDAARQTQQFVPDYLEDLGGMSTEERQLAFHTELIKMRMESIEKRQKEQKPKNNFENNAAAGGGINQGLSTGKLEKDEGYKQPTIFENYEEVLDSKLTDDAYVRELLKGINPDTTSVLGKTDGDDDEFFRQLNDVNNLQNNSEINEALQNIEILSGGDKDTLFGELDLLSTRANNPAENGNFQNDEPYMRDDNPAPVNRWRNAQAIQEVDPSVFTQEDRNDAATTIALGIGILDSAYHGVFGRNDIPETRTGGNASIIDSMNQSLRLMGRRGMFGDDSGLNDNDMYEGRTISSRMNDSMSFSGAKNPEYVDRNTDVKSMQDEIVKSLGMNQATAQGSSLPQLREQQFGYKQAGRSVAHNGFEFIKGGKRTSMMINSEFEP